MKLLDCLKHYSVYLKLDLKENTSMRYLGDLVPFFVYMRNIDSMQLTDVDFIEYITLLKEAGYAHNGLVTKMCHMRRFCRYAHKKGWINFSPELIPVMRKEWKRPSVATIDQYRKVLGVIPKDGKFIHIRNRALIMLYWDTGARNGEIISLDVSDIDTVQMKGIIKTEKSRGKRPFREIFWTEETNQALKKWLELKESIESHKYITDPQALFWGSTNNWQGKRLTNHAVDIILRKYSDLAKIPRLRPHPMRHHMGHDLNEKGANNSQISSILGHSNLSSSYIYTELNDREREALYNKLIRNNSTVNDPGTEEKKRATAKNR